MTFNLSKVNGLQELNSTSLSEATVYSKVFFLSLMHIQNNLYLSPNKEDILKFYSLFDSRDALINWMKDRPKGNLRFNIHHKDDRYIVVIPTVDSNNKFSKNCLYNVYEGLTVIFVESGPNLYFNFAHNMNEGIKKAMEFNPEWIIISNDDVYKIDDNEKLKISLLELDNYKTSIIKSTYGEEGYISRYNKLANFVMALNKKNRIPNLIEKRYGIVNRFYLKEKGLFKRILNKLFLSRCLEVKFTGSFFILSSIYCSSLNGEIFDENYINGFEDVDFFVFATKKNCLMETLDYKIGFFGGKSLGSGDIRTKFRGIANRAYFNLKLENCGLSSNCRDLSIL
ncbi:MAG: hypothetical protein ACYCR2_10930 [Thermoplasmataceae archaeon]